MGSNSKPEIHEPSKKSNHLCPLDVSSSSSRRTLISSDGNKPKAWSSSVLPSPSAKLMKLAEQRDEVSRSVKTSSIRERISGVLHRKIDWTSLATMGKQWIRNPINMALFLWILVVAVSGAILFMVMTGMLNRALPKKSERDAWFEVNNQILNGLFTLMCLYQHPKRFYHLVLLCRWGRDDVAKLRKVYCKNGSYKPHEWMHVMVVVLLLHLNCFAQYALCGLNVGYRRSQRPPIGVAVCISVAIGAPAAAALYTMLSPLGKDYEEDEENQLQRCEEGSVNRRVSLERRYSFASNGNRMVPVSDPQWSGGVLDIWDEISLAYLSLFCTFCVFGWNMERVGFGNMYVHIATFILFCLAPFFIFNLAAVNIDNETVREALGVSGILLCVFGLLYGGFWRIQMRKRFKLPSYKFCFGNAAVADCTLWLFCCWCSLAQEVRTVDSYEIVEDKFCQRAAAQQQEKSLVVSPLPREDGVFDPKVGGLGSSPRNVSGANTPSRFWKEVHSPNVQTPRENGEVKSEVVLTPPSPLSIHREA
ncbi:PLAC8 family protein [Raphanus sativus]|uniref:Uncharacterized protein LOC108805127 n=1 Tax=Raphanus sativus TaxID=3726 RepID=A0A6J0JAA5_RAPSA|nr:uncharacterized protein LOC108805127 [Raphanus sativus]KAJ4893327.1 PLAC8 family protein [Raphanus sativus]